MIRIFHKPQFRLCALLLALILCLPACAPPDGNSELLQALASLHSGSLSEASYRAEICLKQEPDNVYALLLHSYCTMLSAANEAQRAKAIFNFERAVGLAPDNFLVNYYYGWALCENQQYRLALPILEKAQELMPEDFAHKADLRMLLARASAANNLQEKALRYLQPLRVSQPYGGWPEVYNNLGLLALNRADYQGAAEFFKQSIALERENLLAWQNLAVTYDLYLNQPQKAKAAYMQCMLRLQAEEQKQDKIKIQKRIRQLSARN
ncbi:MAG: hypothetical protein PHG44_08160 [Lentisphaeria bacterium]|jgi:tetratricopeptide (TPR) repeat protein|nr:hypothetical protein [Lentisphaeria bacterium]MDY0176323.1 hypothetical protein [Lentisphaeria bacterium]